MIILVVLAIIYRNQLKIWFFRNKSKFKFGKGPKSTSRPRLGVTPQRPGTAPLQLTQRQLRPRQPRRRPPMRRMPQRRTRGERDNAFDDTMKKLRDMSK